MKVQAADIKKGMTFKYGNTPVIATSDAYTLTDGGKDVYIDCVDRPHTIRHRGVPPMKFDGGTKGQACFRATTMVALHP